jgi:hypothetical protein
MLMAPVHLAAAVQFAGGRAFAGWIAQLIYFGVEILHG